MFIDKVDEAIEKDLAKRIDNLESDNFRLVQSVYLLSLNTLPRPKGQGISRETGTRPQ